MKDNYTRTLEAVEAFGKEIQKNVSEPQQKTVDGVLNTFVEELKREYINEESQKPLDLLAIKRTGKPKPIEEGQSNEDNKFKKTSDYYTFTALAISEEAEQKGKYIRIINGELHIYTGTHYEPIEKEELLPNWLLKCANVIGTPELISVVYDTRQTPYYIKAFHRFCSMKTNLGWRASKRAINVKNGIISFDEKGNAKLTPHTPELPYLYCLKYEYNPNATAPTFDKFLSEVLPDKQAQVFLQAYIGSIFTEILPDHKIAFLYGPGGNGKTVFTDIIRALLGGKKNVTTFPLKTLCDEERGKDTRKQIEGKLLNIIGEVGKFIDDSNIFKQLADGSPITGNKKYQNSEVITDYARLLVSCNELPKSNDLTDGFFRRFAPVDFSQKIEKKDPQLKHKIIENELSGVLNWVVEGVRIFVQNECKLPKYDRGDELLLEHILKSDNVLFFLNSKKIEAGEEKVWFSDLYSEYREFALEYGFKDTFIVTKRTFPDRLKKAGIEAKEGAGNKLYVRINRTL